MDARYFSGVMCALVTPLNEDNTLNVPALHKLIDFQLDNGIKGFLVLGGTGEYSQLTMEERVRVVKETVDYAGSKVPVIAGVLEPGLGEAIKFSQSCKDVGADAILLLTPYYILPSQEGIFQYFKTVDKAVNMPIMVYNIPYRTMVNVTPETVERMCDEIPNIIGEKECSPNFGQALDLIRRVGDKITVLSGEEFLMGGEVLMGAKGGIMASANLIPDVWVSMYEYASTGKTAELQELTKKYLPLLQLLFKEVNPGPLKYAMRLRGIECGPVSIPLLDPQDALKEAICKEMKKLELI